MCYRKIYIIRTIELIIEIVIELIIKSVMELIIIKPVIKLIIECIARSICFMIKIVNNEFKTKTKNIYIYIKFFS